MGVLINIRFADATYTNKKEKTKHIEQMIKDGWKIDYETDFFVSFKKSEKIETE